MQEVYLTVLQCPFSWIPNQEHHDLLSFPAHYSPQSGPVGLFVRIDACTCHPLLGTSLLVLRKGLYCRHRISNSTYSTTNSYAANFLLTFSLFETRLPTSDPFTFPSTLTIIYSGCFYDYQNSQRVHLFSLPIFLLCYPSFFKYRLGLKLGKQRDVCRLFWTSERTSIYGWAETPVYSHYK